jgi:hypothetical protein
MLGARWRRAAPVGLAALVACLLVPTHAHAQTTPCSSADLASGGLSGAPVGAAVTLTASSTGCVTPEYKFFLEPPAGSWSAQTAYGSDTWVWQTTHTTPLGTWGIGVWARDQGSTASYESYYIGTVTLTSDLCAPTSVQASGSGPFNLTASTSCPSPQYRFWMLPPGGSWTIVQDWQSANTFTVNATTLGTYELGVWVRSTYSSSAYDSYAITTGFAGACQAAIASTQGNDSVYAGNSVSISAGIIQPPCLANQLFQFWLLPTDGGWTVEQSYSSQGWWTWSTSGFAPGTYQYGLWTKSASSAASYDGYFIGTITVLPARCGPASLTPSVPSPQSPGVTVTFTGGAAGACGGMGEVQFWELPPNSNAWTIMQPYRLYNGFIAPTWAWNTTGLAPGPYRIGVWVRAWNPDSIQRQAVSYDSYAIITYWLGT